MKNSFRIICLTLILIFLPFNVVFAYDNINHSHWIKVDHDWYHINANNEIDRNKWIVWERDLRIYRLGYDGKMCRGWVADPITNIQYFMDKTEDGGHLIMDDMDSTYDEAYNRILETIKSTEKIVLPKPDIIYSKVSQN